MRISDWSSDVCSSDLKAFADVMRGCAEPKPDRPETWINELIIEGYEKLFARGHAHSVECWLNGELAGGLYGVTLGGAFFGESMFTRRTNASDRKRVGSGKSV